MKRKKNKDFGSMLELKTDDFTTPRSIPNTNKRFRSTTLMQSKKSKKSISKLKKEERKKLHQQQIGNDNKIENNKNLTIEAVRQRITELQEELKEIKKERNELEKNLETCRHDLSTTRMELAKTKAEMKFSEEIYVILQTNTNGMDRQINTLTKDYTESSQLLAKNQANLINSNAQLQQAQAELRLAKAELNNTQNKNELNTKEYQRLVQENVQLTQEKQRQEKIIFKFTNVSISIGNKRNRI